MISFRKSGYVLTAIGLLLILAPNSIEVKAFRIILLILGLLLSFESTRQRDFRFTNDDWSKNGDNYSLKISYKKHWKDNPTPRVFSVSDEGTIQEIGVAIKVKEDKSVHIGSNNLIKEIIVKI